MFSSVKKRLSYFYHSIDLFGIQTQFYFDQKRRFHAKCGIFSTFIYTGFILYLFISFGRDMIDHVNPETSISQIYNPNPTETVISRDEYFFVFGMQDFNNMHYIDEEIYTATLFYGNRNQKTKEDELTQIPIERCSVNNMPKNPELAKYFANMALSLSDLYCISKDVNKELVLKGAWDQDEYNFIRLFIAPCNSSERTCKSDETIHDALKSSNFGYYSVDHLFDLRNFENPAQIIGRDYYIETTDTVKKIIRRFIKSTYILDNIGWFSDSISQKVFYSYDYDRETFEILTQKDYIVDFLVRKTNYETIFSRKYKQIQNVLAEMNGLLHFVFIFLYVISYPFIKKEYNDSITNSVYNFEVDDNKNQSIDKDDKKKGINDRNISSFKSIVSPVKESEGNDINMDKNKNKENALLSYFFKLKEAPLKLSYYQMIKGFFTSDPELSLKNKQRTTGISSIFSQLDIKYVLRKFSEIDKLKMILFDEDQYNLFEYLPKPVIMKNAKIQLKSIRKESLSPRKISPLNRKSIFFLHQNDLVLKAKTVQKAYENIVQKEEMNEIDRKLIENLDEDILNLLETNGEEGTKNNRLQEEQSPKKIMKARMEEIDTERASIFSEKKGEVIVHDTF